MALEEELQKEEAKRASQDKEEEEVKNFDNLTDEQIEAVKEVAASEGWNILLECMKKRVENQEKSIIALAKDNCFNAKTEGFSFYEVLGAFIQGMGEMERLLKVITTDPEDVRKAQEAMKNAEAIMRGEKVEGVD